MKESFNICLIHPQHATTDIAVTCFKSVPDLWHNCHKYLPKIFSCFRIKNIIPPESYPWIILLLLIITINKHTLILIDKCAFFIFELRKTKRPRHHQSSMSIFIKRNYTHAMFDIFIWSYYVFHITL